MILREPTDHTGHRGMAADLRIMEALDWDEGEAAEAVDPEGRQWPRTKRSDDATVVYLALDGTQLLAEQAAWDGLRAVLVAGSLVLPSRPGWRDLAGR